MALSQTDLDALDKAIASGALTVKYADGSQVTYRSHAELLAARSHVAGIIAPAGTAAGSRISLATFV